MCRRRLLKSNFYINYGGTKKAHGETVIVSPFVAGGNSDTFELYARNPWVITNNLSWLTVSSLSNKSGKYTITITAAENQAYSERSGSFTAKTLDDRFSIVVSVSQQAKPSVRYIEIVPATASISSLGTTSFTCILHDNGTETDVTSLVEWSSSDTNAATISNGTATGRNNTKTEKQVTITAEYDGLSATATLNVAAGVVSWRNYRILIGADEGTRNTPVNLDATNITNGIGVGAYIDEYVNEVKLQTWAFTEGSNWSIGDDSIARFEKISEMSRHVFSVYNEGAFYPDQRTTEITATTTRGTQTFTATKIVNVAPQGLVTHYISVEPTTATIGSTGEVQLKVLYHTVTDGVDDDGVDVTTSAGYTDKGSNLIDVNATGKVNGSGSETGGNAVVTVSYPGVESVDVPITVRDATVDYRNFRVIPLSMTLGKDDVTAGEQIQAYVDVFVNNVFSEELEVTADASWSSKNTNVASVSKSGTNEVVKPVYGDGYFPTTRTTQVQASYLGSAATCDVTVEPEGRIEHIIVVTPASVNMGAVDERQLSVTYYEVVDGVTAQTGTDITNSATYGGETDMISISNGGKITSNNTGESPANATITVNYGDAPQVNVPVVAASRTTEEYLVITPATTSTTWNGEVEYEVYYVIEINGHEADRVKITNPDHVQFTLSNNTAGQMDDFTFKAENISTSNKTVNITAICTGGTYSGIMTKTPATLTVNGADSVDYRLDVEAVPTSIAYSGSSQLYASAVTVVNGSVYKWYVPDDVVWGENSTAITISNDTVTGTHTGTSSTSAVITGSSQSFGESGTVTITIGGRPEAALHVTRDNPTVSTVYVDSGAGQCNYYVSWSYLKPGTSILLQTHNLDSITPAITEIQITDTNYRGGSMTIVGNYSENPFTAERDLYLNGTATTYYDKTITGNTWYVQRAKETPAVITYENLRFKEVYGSTDRDKSYTSLSSAGTDWAYFAYEDVMTNGTKTGERNASTICTYELKSGSTTIATFNGGTGTKYDGVYLTISYSTNSGFTFRAHNGDTEPKSYVLYAQDGDLSASFNIDIEEGETPMPTISVSVGGLSYCVVKSGNKNVDSVRFQTLTVGVGSSTVAGAERTFENVSTGISSSSSTWSSTSFVGNVGETIKATLHLYLDPTGTSIDGDVTLQAAQQTFTGTQVSHSADYYVYEFNIGTVPSASVSLGNFTVSVPIGLDTAWLNISGEGSHNYSHDASAINGQSFPVTWANVNVSSIAVSNYTGNITGATITGTTTKYLVVNAKANESTTSTATSVITITGTSLNDGTVVSAELIIEQSKAEPLPAGVITWNDMGGSIKASGNFDDNVYLDWTNLSTAHPITFDCAYFDLDNTTTSYTITTENGTLSADWFNEHFMLTENQSTNQRTIIITASGVGLDGELVTATIASLKQAGGSSLVPKVYVGQGENSMILVNNYPTSVTLNHFSVGLGSPSPVVYGFNANGSGSYATGTTNTVSGTRNATTGESQYYINAEWRPTTATTVQETSIIRWKENGVQQEETIDGWNPSIPTRTVTVDTVLTDFELIVKAQNVATVSYNYAPITVSNRANKSIRVTSGRITFTDNATAGNKNYVFPNMTSTIVNGQTVQLGPSSTPTSISTKSGSITVTLNSVRFEFDTDKDVPTRVNLYYDNYNSGSRQTIGLAGDSSGIFTSDTPLVIGYVGVGESYGLLGEANFILEITD